MGAAEGCLTRVATSAEEAPCRAMPLQPSLPSKATWQIPPTPRLCRLACRRFLLPAPEFCNMIAFSGGLCDCLALSTNLLHRGAYLRLPVNR